MCLCPPPLYLGHAVNGVGKRVVIGDDLPILGEQSDEGGGAGACEEEEREREGGREGGVI
jgi:hypothetical protein